jgi:hypothetical protein
MNCGSFEAPFAGLFAERRLSPGSVPNEQFFRSWANYGTSRNGQKTYGSVFGMIFFGGAGSPLVIERQWLTRGKITKNLKNAKKSAK